MQHISSQTRQKISEEVGKFVLVSWRVFEVDGGSRTRYTVRKPNGTKSIHLVGYENGTIRRAD